MVEFLPNNKIITSIDNAINCHNRSTRDSIASLSNDNDFKLIFDQTIRQDKERVFKKLQKFSNLKVVSVKDFRKDPQNIFTAHEALSYLDGSLATKFTVQFNLFGGTLIALGTEKHEKYLDLIDKLNVIGCFCLTEVGYGNNAVEMETTATYDSKTKEFVINCPTVKSQKFWITNGAYHANYAIVFAQTIVNNKNEGINAFLVRIREDDGSTSKGVTIDDMGHKMGMNGVDNARIIFRNVRCDSNSLLNKIGNINIENSTFSSVIQGRRARFIYAADRLLSGRLCISSMMISAAKLALVNTIYYAKGRLSNGKSGKSDTPIFNYQLFQNQIIPLLGRTLIQNVALIKIREFYSSYIIMENSKTLTDKEKTYLKEHKNYMIRLCCVIKPLICWHTNEVGNICRERCGGQGYLSINLLDSAINGAHSGITAEGDAAVLMQKVSKEYVEDFVKQKLRNDEIKIYKYNDVLNKNSSSKLKDKLSKLDNIYELDILMELLCVREIILLGHLAQVTAKNINNIYDTWMLNESNTIQELSKCYGVRMGLELFIKSSLFEDKKQ